MRVVLPDDFWKQTMDSRLEGPKHAAWWGNQRLALGHSYHKSATIACRPHRQQDTNGIVHRRVACCSFITEVVAQEQYTGTELRIQVPVGTCGSSLDLVLDPLSAVALEPGRCCELNGITAGDADEVPVATASIMALLGRGLACISISRFPADSQYQTETSDPPRTQTKSPKIQTVSNVQDF